MVLNGENYGIAPWRLFRERIYPVFAALSGILKILGIAPEYKYYVVNFNFLLKILDYILQNVIIVCKKSILNLKQKSFIK